MRILPVLSVTALSLGLAACAPHAHYYDDQGHGTSAQGPAEHMTVGAEQAHHGGADSYYAPTHDQMIGQMGYYGDPYEPQGGKYASFHAHEERPQAQMREYGPTGGRYEFHTRPSHYNYSAPAPRQYQHNAPAPRHTMAPAQRHHIRDDHGRTPAPNNVATAIDRGQIAEAQAALHQLGFDPGRVDGIVGPKTRRAVDAYNAHQGMPTSEGQITHSLLSYLRADLNVRIEPEMRPATTARQRY